MIQFRGDQVVGFGLSRKNCELLLEGKPILVKKEKLDIPFDIIIFAGETEDQMAEQLKEVMK